MEVTNKAGAPLRVFNESSIVRIIVSGPDALRERIILWSLHVFRPIEPSIELVFSLAEEPSLGELKLTTNSWTFAHDLAVSGFKAVLAAAKGPSLVTAQLVPVKFVARNGSKAGELVSYQRLRLVPEPHEGLLNDS